MASAVQEQDIDDEERPPLRRTCSSRESCLGPTPCGSYNCVYLPTCKHLTKCPTDTLCGLCDACIYDQ